MFAVMGVSRKMIPFKFLVALNPWSGKQAREIKKKHVLRFFLKKLQKKIEIKIENDDASLRVCTYT